MKDSLETRDVYIEVCISPEQAKTQFILKRYSLHWRGLST